LREILDPDRALRPGDELPFRKASHNRSLTSSARPDHDEFELQRVSVRHLDCYKKWTLIEQASKLRRGMVGHRRRRWICNGINITTADKASSMGSRKELGRE
jgi:hypothetical protein